MIDLSPHIDLGGDKTRMKNVDDVRRQEATARALLQRLYAEEDPSFTEVQLLADEVGLGKTFVALAVAYSLLEAQRRQGELRGTQRRVLVLVPQNDELAKKWNREVAELVKRCVRPEHQATAERCFQSTAASRPDEIVAALASKHRVVIAKTSALGARLKQEDDKARLTLAALFRHWGRALPLENRALLLKGAAEWGWPQEPAALGALDDAEIEKLPLTPEDVASAVSSAAGGSLASSSTDLLALCKACGAPYARNRTSEFKKIRDQLLHFYKRAVFELVQDLPLVIVDEAHQWKNKANHYEHFIELIAPRARRALLLTATPFQLDPAEVLTLLQIGEHLRISARRQGELEARRKLQVEPALERAREESAAFSEQWGRLGSRLDSEALHEAWNSPELVAARSKLERLVQRGEPSEAAVRDVLDPVRFAVAPELRDFVCQALRLFVRNLQLSRALGSFVVRHRRGTLHRVVRAGREVVVPADQLAGRPDAHVLHAAPGLEVHGDAELPLYLIMRATSELEQGKRTASLGSSLTGCYSTFFASAESKDFRRADKSATAATYVGLLQDLVGGQEADAAHPKMRTAVEEIVARWERGEKSLVFTFRVNTAERLQELVQAEVSRLLDERKRLAFQGEGGLRALRKRLTDRTGSLFPLLLDRVLWSVVWAPPDGGQPPFSSTDLWPTREDYDTVAELALRCDVDVGGKHADRLFLHRAAECALARRLRSPMPPRSRAARLLEQVADVSWVEQAYGGITADSDAESDTLADERGVHTSYVAVRTPSPEEIRRLADDLVAKDANARRTGQVSVVRQAFVGPSFWLGADPERELLAREHHPADVEVDRSDQRFLHVHLRELTWERGGTEPDLRTRALAFQAMRRALLREALLVRLLPRFEERGEEGWATLLVKHITEKPAVHQESVLRRLGVFIEDLASASGSIDDPKSARFSLYEATKAKKASQSEDANEAVALVTGDTRPETRSRRFQGFNSPLLPEILICGQIAQEGIDLHRHCSHVLHYDLAWNPATLEQRTGRIDRIGSRTQRLRQLAAEEGLASGTAYLEVDTPYLAGTYDERMFEELRLRAQTFEVLLGGELARERESNTDPDSPEDQGEELARDLVALPRQMAEDLGVDLAVWRPSLRGAPGLTTDPLAKPIAAPPWVASV